MKGGEDPGSLTFKQFDSDFPLSTNCLSLVIGGTGSGKSYFTYNYLLPAYVEYFECKWILICSKTASCDATLQAALAKTDAEVIIDPSIGSLFNTAQLIRAQAIKTDYINRLVQAKDIETELHLLKKEIVKMRTYPTIKSELEKLISMLTPVLDEDNYTVITKKYKKYRGDEDKLRRMKWHDEYEEKSDKEEPDNEEEFSETSSDNDEACIQTIELENPVQTKIYKDNKYDPEEEDPELANIDISYAIVLNRSKVSKLLASRLIKKRIKENLTNLLYAAEEIYGNTYQPIFMVVDDNAVSSELSNQNSSFTQLCLTRRHLHTSIVILVQGVTYLNTSIRRNATDYHLLPTMSDEDLKLIEKRLPKGLIEGELSERYLANTRQQDRSQQMTHIFIASNPPRVIDGCPDCISQYKL